MTAGNGIPSLTGQTFDCAFGTFVPRLTFGPADQLRVQAIIGDTEIDETVKAEVKTLRPGLIVVNWTEANGNFIVQVQDHERNIVHNYARLADGQLFCAEGELRAVAA